MLYTVEQHFYSNNSHWVYQIILSVRQQTVTDCSRWVLVSLS